MITLSKDEIVSLIEAIEVYKKSFSLTGVAEKNLNSIIQKLKDIKD